jgi:hypothetical protein
MSWKLGVFAALCASVVFLGCGDHDDDQGGGSGNAGEPKGGSSSGSAGKTGGGTTSAGSGIVGKAGGDTAGAAGSDAAGASPIDGGSGGAPGCMDEPLGGATWTDGGAAGAGGVSDVTGVANPLGGIEQFWPQQNLIDIHMATAWGRPVAPASPGDAPLASSGGHADVYVCVIDNGVQLTHPELSRAGNVGWDLPNAVDTTAPLSLLGQGAHATAIAGIALAEWGSRNGIVGIGPELRLLSIAAPQPMTSIRLVGALDESRLHAVPNEGAEHPKSRRVILISGSFQSYSPTQQTETKAAVEKAISAGIPVIIGTGNGNAVTGVPEAVQFPATISGVITVGAIRLSAASATRADGESPGPGAPSLGGWSSNYDATTEFVVAPGRNIPSTDLFGTDGYNTSDANSGYTLNFRGTEAAAAHVAGLAGLLLSHNSDLTVADVRSILARTAEKLIPTYPVSPSDANHPLASWNEEVGYGRINADAAVRAALTSKVKVRVVRRGSGTSANYVDVPFGSRASATIRLSHDNPNLASAVEYTLPTPPEHFAWYPATPPSPVVVARGDHVDVKLLYQPPSATDASTGEIVITTGQDHWTPSVTLSVSGNAVEPSCEP